MADRPAHLTLVEQAARALHDWALRHENNGDVAYVMTHETAQVILDVVAEHVLQRLAEEQAFRERVPLQASGILAVVGGRIEAYERLLVALAGEQERRRD